jgi:hypothetical protein
MKPKKPDNETSPVFTRGHLITCPGISCTRKIKKCGEIVNVWKATRCPDCVRLKKSWETKGWI